MGKSKYLVIGTGMVVGLAALLLTAAGNPANMGFCIACFLRDIAGGLGLHSAEKVQYLRPEIVGLVLGAMFAALAGREYKVKKADGFVLPGFMVAVLALLIAAPAFIHFSQAGPGASHAFWLVSLAGGLVVGALAQKSRLCMAGGLRDVFLFRDFHLVSGFIAIFVTVLIGNLILGNFHAALEVQPVAHHDYLWSFLGMGLVGWGSVLLGGCPLRQLILAGEGSGDSAVTVLGMIVGAAIAHNFGMAGNADAMTDGVFTAGGVAMPGRIGICIGLVLLLVISIANLHKEEKAK